MAADNTQSSSKQADFQDIFDQATDEKVEHERLRAEVAVAAAELPRRRVTATALGISVPILAILLGINVFGVSLVDLVTPNPSPDVARRKAQEALDAVVKDIEGYREDYSELPERLIEVTSPSRGQWTYSRKPNGQYQLVVNIYGQVLTFDSSQRRGANGDRR